MPNFDGGHYFLTVLAPIRTDTVLDRVVLRTRSHVHTLAQKLALLAVGPQTAQSPPDVHASPFSKNKLNHFARLVIINRPNYNGRESGDTILSLGKNPLIAQPVDSFSRPYLVFAADFDAPTGTDADLTAYATELWSTMHEDLKSIFGHCCGFEGIETAEGFAAYLRSCQVETTFGFNDYWADGLKAPDGKAPLPLLKRAAWLTGGLLALWAIATALVHLPWVAAHPKDWFAKTVSFEAVWGLLAVLAGAGLIVLSVYVLYRWAMTNGAKPFPRAPGGDLETILKALFQQQAFTRFAIEAQGLSDAELHARFGKFLAATKPDKLNDPPTEPGQFRAAHVEWN